MSSMNMERKTTYDDLIGVAIFVQITIFFRRKIFEKHFIHSKYKQVLKLDNIQNEEYTAFINWNTKILTRRFYEMTIGLIYKSQSNSIYLYITYILIFKVVF